MCLIKKFGVSDVSILMSDSNVSDSLKDSQVPGIPMIIRIPFRKKWDCAGSGGAAAAEGRCGSLRDTIFLGALFGCSVWLPAARMVATGILTFVYTCIGIARKPPTGRDSRERSLPVYKDPVERVGCGRKWSRPWLRLQRGRCSRASCR